ncbi:Neutral ceramidase precursor [Rosistilla ulvae]|uniref:Neutral ceramidase n=1 Tax=Rosistilla ulvae TaxID=1930277 RepID=A0A517LU52_9BACT|nr:neutral/alkaline non-lysosomal ceramidase N-terminal domain-containing protein [Rosistilla ulvae]QDS86136.1 Neutral ceramidase precursor [Rosistilla ulvae]
MPKSQPPLLPPHDRRRFLASLGAATTAAAWPCHGIAAEATSKSGSLSIGHAVVDTTPPLGIELAGFHKPVGQERRITGIRQKTAARALVLQVADQSVAIVSLDILSVSPGFTQQVQRQVAKQTGIPAANVRVCATHTHSMPAFSYLRQWGAIPEEYLQETLGHVVDAVVQAHRDLSAAELYVGKSSVDGGNFNRTSPTWKTDQEFTTDATDADRWLDTILHVLRFERANKPDVLWYHFACHPVCYRDGEAGPDWLGLVADQVQAKHGVVPGFLQGHAGDVNPGNGKIWIGEAEPTAAAIVQGIDRALDASERVDANELRLVSEPFALPLNIDLLQQQLELYREHPEQCASGQWVDAGFAKAWYESAKDWDLQRTTHATPTTALRLGDLGILFHSSELYSYYGLQIQRDSPLKNTIVVGYTDDLIGYLVDPRAYEAGEYAAVTVPRILDLPPFKTAAASQLADFANQLLTRTT